MKNRRNKCAYLTCRQGTFWKCERVSLELRPKSFEVVKTFLQMRMISTVPDRLLAFLVHIAATPMACSASYTRGGPLGCGILSAGLFLIAGVLIPLASAYYFEKLQRAQFLKDRHCQASR